MIFHGIIIFCLVLSAFFVGYLNKNTALSGLLVSGVLLLVICYYWHQVYLIMTLINKEHDQRNITHISFYHHIKQLILQKEQSTNKRLNVQKHNIAHLERIISTIPSSILLIDKKGDILWHNRRFKEYFELSNDIYKRSLFGMINDKAFINFIKNSLKSTNIDEHKLKWQDKSYLMTLIPFESNSRMLIAHDISANEQLIISKNNFIANVSHELRTPLTVIEGFLETLSENSELPKELQKEFITLMQKESRRMLDLVNELLFLSRLENDDDKNTDFLMVNISQMMNEIAKEAQRLSNEHHISTNITHDIMINGVDKELYSAFSNLVFNAVRHTPSGTHIDINLSKNNDDQVVFFVKDDGEGIAKEHLAHLTERFYRVDKGRSRKTGGTGLGLAIAKHIFVKHHATLQIDSEIGVGSCFKVTFRSEK